PALGEHAMRFGALRVNLARAIAQAELSVHYLPIAELASGRVVGVEALLRWRHPEYGWIAPQEFLPVGERSGLIGDLGAFALRQAAGAAVGWQRAGLAGLGLTLNLATVQFRVQDVATLVRDALATGLDPTALELDLSDRALGGEVDDVI